MRLKVAAAVAVIFSNVSNAETIRFSDLDEATRVYIQRGNYGMNVECYFHVLDMLENAHPNYNPADYFVTFDDPEIDGVAVGAVDAGEYYTCIDGVLKSWDAGESVIIKRF